MTYIFPTFYCYKHIHFPKLVLFLVHPFTVSLFFLHFILFQRTLGTTSGPTLQLDFLLIFHCLPGDNQLKFLISFPMFWPQMPETFSKDPLFSVLLPLIFKCSVQFSCSVVSKYLWPPRLQYARPPCPSPTPGVYSNSCPLSRWCHPTISSSVVPFSSCPQSFPASGSFQMSQFFASSGQSIGFSASKTVLPMNTQDWSPLGDLGEHFKCSVF